MFSAYKFVTSIVTRVKTLLELSDEYEEAKMTIIQLRRAKFKKVSTL